MFDDVVCARPCWIRLAEAMMPQVNMDMAFVNIGILSKK
jgi:hypothetical protein